MDVSGKGDVGVATHLEAVLAVGNADLLLDQVARQVDHTGRRLCAQPI
jgi:hypothetical protein